MTIMLSAAGAQTPEMLVAMLAMVGLSCGVLYLLLRWLTSGPLTPDPWSPEIEAELARSETAALCHRCLCPHDDLVYFCPECGAPVGEYTNLLPFPYLFSIGHTLRIGSSGEFKRTPLTVAGFFLMALAENAVFAPVYWYVFLRGLLRRPANQP